MHLTTSDICGGRNYDTCRGRNCRDTCGGGKCDTLSRDILHHLWAALFKPVWEWNLWLAIIWIYCLRYRTRTSFYSFVGSKVAIITGTIFTKRSIKVNCFVTSIAQWRTARVADGGVQCIYTNYDKSVKLCSPWFSSVPGKAFKLSSIFCSSPDSVFTLKVTSIPSAKSSALHCLRISNAANKCPLPVATAGGSFSIHAILTIYDHKFSSCHMMYRILP